MYYRVHTPGTPAFSAENAWSSVWGAKFLTPNGSRIGCRECATTDRFCWGCQENRDDCGHSCPQCDDTGEQDADRGYSCLTTPAALVERFAGWDDAEPVAVFDGEETGEGIEGEPLVVPDMATVTWTTLGALRTTTQP